MKKGGIFMENNQKKIFLQTKLRNLKRKYAKMIQHPDLNEECIDLKCEIDALERELRAY